MPNQSFEEKLEEVEKNAREQIYAIIGLEIDPDGNDNALLIRNEDDVVENAIDFTQEINEIVKLLKRELTTQREETIKECIETISVHSEKNGGYCDTGEDMEWSCRADCVKLAMERLLNLIKP